MTKRHTTPRPHTGAATRTTAIIPRASYRLQLHKDFDFEAAGAVLPYLARLGVSHVYCSPIGTARPGSLHGYDVTDPTRINPELGGEAGFERFAAAARALGLGLLLDQVPNHMGIYGAENPWWIDVLENGPAAEHAHCFDIDWHPATPGLDGKVLLPVLDKSYGDALDAGEMRLALDAETGRFWLHWATHRFPLDPRTTADLLRAAGPALGALADAFAALPPRELPDDAARAARTTVQRELQRSLAETLARDSDAAAALARVVDELNTPASRETLHTLHDAQAYRLAHWRSATEQINYRRFFDINDLAALRIEDPSVFEATHATALALCAEGKVDGLRIDHPDGLLDPAAYFARLQAAFAARRGLPDEEAQKRPLYVLAEKIAAGFEQVPRDWALHGTTGYRFAAVAGGLFVERRNADRMERLWRTTCGVGQNFEAMVRQTKHMIALGALGAPLTGLADTLHRIALADRHTRDFGLPSLREAIATLAACLPVYRTYLAPEGPPSSQDRRFVDWAVAQARTLGDPADAALYDFVRRCLLAEPMPGASPEIAGEVRAFALRFQQFSSPVAAKGVEDTAYYRYHRLISLNEVGGDPAVFGISASAFHGASADRAENWPATMLASSTHDNKRAEDVRHRIHVLSEEPAAWRLALRRWRLATRGWRTEIDDAEAPSAADQYLLHQTLLGALPPEGLGEDTLPAFRERIEAYMLKAVREAKLQTSWARPDADYENALMGLVRGLLGRVEGNLALAQVQEHAARLAWFGALNSIAMNVLKYASPGVPDLYQGTELIDLSLVDPDNRRPVDYARRESTLSTLEAMAAGGDIPAQVAALGATPTDGRLKLWATWRLLQHRRAHPALFAEGRYLPLRVSGTQRRHVIAFARQHEGAVLVVIVARKFVGLHAPVGTLPVGRSAWSDTAIELPPTLRELAEGEDLLAGERIRVIAGAIALGDALARLPFATIRFDAPNLRSG